MWKKNGVGRTGLAHAKKIKIYHHITPYTIINSKWIKDLKINHDTINIPEENIDSKISDILYSKIFADTSFRARETKEKK